MKWYVVDVQQICIDSEWDDVGSANQRRTDMVDEGCPLGSIKVMTKPAIGGQKLPPEDDASWCPRRDDVKENPGRRDHVRENPGELLVVNPDDGELDTEHAEEVSEMWHKKPPRNVGVIDTGCDGDDEMCCVGTAHDIVYRSSKWEKGRKTNDYVHHFGSPKVWMLRHLVEDGLPFRGEKTVEQLLRPIFRTRNEVIFKEQNKAVLADLAAPLSFCLKDGTTEGDEVAIHTGSRVYGAIDQRTIVIVDPHWQLIVIRGGEMSFDERGIVK